MIDEFVKTMKANLYERATSPLAGAFIISWCVWNYQIIIYLISYESPQDKINFIQTCLSFKTSFLFPLLTATFFIFVYPYPARVAYWFWRKQKKAMRDIRQKIEEEELLTPAESRDIKRKIYALESEYDAEIKRKDDEIKDLKILLSEQKKKIEEELLAKVGDAIKTGAKEAEQMNKEKVGDRKEDERKVEGQTFKV